MTSVNSCTSSHVRVSNIMKQQACGNDDGQDSIMLFIAQTIQQGECSKARVLLRESMLKNMECPIAYNLLGITYEKEGNRLKAAKFYRVAYYMDQNFKPAAENLNRICNFLYAGMENISWGVKIIGGKDL